MAHLPSGTVTLLFTDIERSTQLLHQLGDRYAELLAAHHRLVRLAFGAWDGVEVDNQGDSFFVAFASAGDAVCAAIDAQRALAAHAWPAGVAVRVRMGLHTDEPSISGGRYVGVDVHRAARIGAAAHGGQVLLSATTRELAAQHLPAGARLRDLGRHRLKDLAEPQALYQLVVDGLPADFPPPRTLDRHRHNLLVQPTPLVGREAEIAAVCALLRRDGVRLVTLTGPGGAGKTRLAQQVAAELLDDFPDGVWFINLAPLTNSTLVPRSIAQVLGVKEAGDRPVVQALVEALTDREVLLILDNFEQVVDAAPAVAELLAACPRLAVLVTSRTVLRLAAERAYPVPPLALPDSGHLPAPEQLGGYEAVRLFLERAQAAKPDFRLTEANAPAMAEICRQLDGLPLAIELAAARVRLFPPPALLARLGRRLELLTGGAQDLPTRQQTLRSTIDWSHDLLDPDERALFARLAVFVGGCTLEAVGAVCGANAGPCETSPGVISAVLDGVESLVSKNLLRQWEGIDSEPRLGMLETIREYAAERLEQSGEAEDLRQRHAEYYLGLVEARVAPSGFGVAPLLGWLEEEHDNLRAVLRLAREREEFVVLGLRLAGRLWGFWNLRGYVGEGREWLDGLLHTAHAAPASLRAHALFAAGVLAMWSTDLARAEAYLHASLELYRALDDPVGTAHVLHELGILARRGNAPGGAHAHRELAGVAPPEGDPARAATYLGESLALRRALGDRLSIAEGLDHLGGIAAERGEYEQAWALLAESLTLKREVGNQSQLAQTLAGLGDLALLQGADQQACERYEESLALFRAVGNTWGIARMLHSLGFLATERGEYDRASEFLEESLALERERGNRERVAGALGSLGLVALHQGDVARASALLHESLTLYRALDLTSGIARCLVAFASLAAAQGQQAQAARLLGAVERLRAALGRRVAPADQTRWERRLAAARAQVGETAWRAAWAEGRALSLDQAIAITQGIQVPVTISAGAPTVPHAAAAPTYPAGLTAREVEVLRLVAAGLTDAQVAERLYLSPRTVNTHLTSVYNKLGVSTRLAAARFALDHRLA